MARCVKSLLNQDVSHDEYEIILVNDGSTDNSGLIADEICQNSRNVRVFHKENGGLSDARNFGLDKADGKYIWFIDSDDYIKENCLGNLLKFSFDEDIDYIDFPIYEVNNSSKYLYNFINKPQNRVDNVSFIRDFNLNFSAWCFISKRSIWLNNNISFIRGIIHEDHDSILHLLENCSSCSHYNQQEGLYYYITGRSGSITSTKNEKRYIKSIKSWIEIINLTKERYLLSNNKNQYSVEVRKYLSYFECMLVNSILNSTLLYKKKKEYLDFASKYMLLPKDRPKRYPNPNGLWRLLFPLMKNIIFLKCLCLILGNKYIIRFINLIHKFFIHKFIFMRK
ncbi:glycosyltransferase family 2 protein [Pasteurella atlantica]|nr:glycosyltransferase family 2 protein [Pasteurella atlantica]QVE21017.1 glycosyltransferase family 2 protein [Pasteurella atlantica]